VLISPGSRAANDTQTSENGGKKNMDNGKKKDDKNGKGKGGKKGDKKKNMKKGGKKNPMQDNKGKTAAADGKDGKRSCKCCLSVLLYIMRRSLLTFELGSSRRMGKFARRLYERD
jgi:hypothetical protein